MNLVAQTKIFWSWYFRIFNTFWGVRPGVFTTVVLFSLIEKFCNLIAMVLPLKIILLASSEGIPKYFQFFMGIEYKQHWIIGLSAAAIGFHLVGFGFSAISERLAALGGAEVVAKANEINVVYGREQKLRNYYSAFCRILSSATFVFLVLSVLVWLDDTLLLALLCSLSLQYMFSVWVLRPLPQARMSRVGRFAKNELPDYLNSLTYVNFIVCFVIVLMPFVLGYPASVFSAVVSIILLRHAINAIGGIVKDCVKLWGWKDGIDPLVLRNVQVKKNESPETVSFRQLLEKSSREEWVARILPKNVLSEASVSVEWLDPPQKGINTFQATVDTSSDCKKRSFLLQVMDVRWKHLISNEQYLLKHVPHDVLLAPARVATVMEDEFAAQFLEVEDGKRASNELWRKVEKIILLEHWSYCPSRALCSGFVLSHPLLHQRVTLSFVKKVSLAIDTEDEAKVFSLFLNTYPELIRVLQSLPLYVFNPDLQRDNVIVSGGQSPKQFVTSWGRWALEPVGVKLPAGASEILLEDMIHELRQKRPTLPEDYSIFHLSLANRVFRLESMINGQKFKAALAEMSIILENSLLRKGCGLAESA
ncbi:hypothetical protein [Microbulbifer elongatus]|uniref:hypothetical protein n=1 Tax=Microbulbifer elongatus TaxID=86173 RepID=UPI001E4AD265|nr:hypothetical protein [Microbulbifer elongatus]